MAIRGCKTLAVEGAHGTGKSTVVHALVSDFKSRNIHVGSFTEIARNNPFVEACVIHGADRFDVVAELDLLGSQMCQELRASRYHELLVCDRTVANVIGYSRVLLEDVGDKFTRTMLASMEQFSRSYAVQYDAVIFTSDLYDLEETNDPFRPKDRSFQDRASVAIRQVCIDYEMPLHDLPRGLTVAEKVSWINENVRLI